MSIKKRRHAIEEVGLSFLDVICCGFGAVILLLMIAKVMEPTVLESTELDAGGQVAALQDELFKIRGETEVLNRELLAKREQLSENRLRVARLKGGYTDILGRLQALTDNPIDQIREIEELERAKQSLTDEMRRLLGDNFVRTDNLIAGIPVDSEYVIFVIDTSGSMFNFAWPRLQRELINILDIYPKVKGLQIMNDQGQYMFSGFKGRWIEDTATRRNAIKRRIGTWSPFSNSSPVEGLTAAIRRFYKKDKKISIFVMGDEFTGPSIDRVVKVVDRINRSNRSGERLVRIHAIGFPVQFAQSEQRQVTGVRFAILMRELAQRNNGSFVGLNSFQ